MAMPTQPKLSREKNIPTVAFVPPAHVVTDPPSAGSAGLCDAKWVAALAEAQWRARSLTTYARHVADVGTGRAV